MPKSEHLAARQDDGHSSAAARATNPAGSSHWLKIKNPNHPAVLRLLEEDWNGCRRRAARGPRPQRGMARPVQDDDRAIYLTVFADPEAEQRARDYFAALKGGGIKIIRAGAPSH
jgi:hypothetical protein